MGQPFVLGPTAARHLDLGNFGARVLATGAETDGQFSLLETVGEPVGFGPPMHIHHDAAEAFFVLDGDYAMHIEDEQYVCPPGSFVYVPAAEAAGTADEEGLARISARHHMEIVGPVPDSYL